MLVGRLSVWQMMLADQEVKQPNGGKGNGIEDEVETESGDN